MPESAEHSGSSPVFGIPLQHHNRVGFESWGKFESREASANESIASQIVGGLNEFIGDHDNRLLRCLAEGKFFSLFSTSENSIQEQSSSQFENAADEEFEFQPTRSLAPLVLYGETGTGKTALAMTLIARFIQQTDGDASVNAKPVCLPGSEFFRRHLAAMDRQSITEFRMRILSSPGLVIDNIGQLQNKVSAQRELAYLIDQLALLGKPVVVTIKKSPLSVAAASLLIPTLLSRLTGGVSFPVYPPGLEARREIISRLAELHRVTLTQEAADWIANRMAVSVPKLNHFFTQLKTELKSRAAKLKWPATTSDKAVDMATLGLIFQQDESANELMAQQIIDTVAADFELSAKLLCSNSRKQTIVMARGVAIWLERTLLGSSYHKIGTRFGGRDHTTILHAFQKFDAIVKEHAANDTAANSDSNSALCNRIRNLQQRLNETFAGQMTLVL